MKLKKQERINASSNELLYGLPEWVIEQKRRSGKVVALAGAWDGASKKRRQIKEFLPKSGDADADTLDDLPLLRERSRYLLRNAPIALGAVNTNVTNVIGSGLKLQSRINAEALGMSDDEAEIWQQNTELEFRAWAESADCDISRRNNFYDLQSLVFRSVLESGDVLVNLPFKKVSTSHYGTRLQVIEADRLCNPNNKQDTADLVAGVEKDQFGAPKKYHIKTQHPGASKKTESKWTNINAFSPSGRKNIIRIYRQLGPGQTRGVPYLSPVIEMFHQLKKYTDAELQSAVISSYFTVFVKTPEGGTDFGPFQPTSESGGATSDEDYRMASGAVIDLAEGESIETANPGRPNTAFDPFIQAILRQAGVSLELPFELLVMHFTKSYSAARTAMLNAWKSFFTKRSFLINHYCNPVYEAWMEEAVLLGRVAAPGFLEDPLMRKAYLGNIWIGPAPGQIDPTKETAAAQARVDGLFSTRSAETAAMGGDFDQNIKQLALEEKKIKALGIGGGSSTPVAPGAKPAVPDPEEEETEEDSDDESGEDED
jgi:lambda family phage portal protein